MKKRKEIRIVDPSKDIWDMVSRLAKKEKRTIGKQGEFLIQFALDKIKNG